MEQANIKLKTKLTKSCTETCNILNQIYIEIQLRVNNRHNIEKVSQYWVKILMEHVENIEI